MPTWSDHVQYWQDVEPRLCKHLETSTKGEVHQILVNSVAFAMFVTEGLATKRTASKDLGSQLDLFVVFATDQLRASLVLYANLNLAPAAMAARATFENCAVQRYITVNANPALLADRYNRFREILRVKAYQTSNELGSLPPSEEARILAENPEWVDPKTGKLHKRLHWTGRNGISFETLVRDAGMDNCYSLYRSTSQFAHASPSTINLYRSTVRGFGPIPDEVQSRRMTLLIAMFALETIVDHCRFFGIAYGEKEYFGITRELRRLS